jgi:hypothetical protein
MRRITVPTVQAGLGFPLVHAGGPKPSSGRVGAPGRCISVHGRCREGVPRLSHARGGL